MESIKEKAFKLAFQIKEIPGCLDVDEIITAARKIEAYLAEDRSSYPISPPMAWKPADTTITLHDPDTQKWVTR